MPEPSVYDRQATNSNMNIAGKAAATGDTSIQFAWDGAHRRKFGFARGGFPPSDPRTMPAARKCKPATKSKMLWA
jgi:hypothetical protein